MRIALASVVIDLVNFEVLRILDQKFERVATTLPCLQSFTQDFGRVFAAIDGDELHAGSNTGQCRRHLLNRVSDGAVFAKFKANGISSGGDMAGTLLIAQHLRWSPS